VDQKFSKRGEARSPGDKVDPPDAEAKFEIGVQFLTFSCTKI